MDSQTENIILSLADGNTSVSRIAKLATRQSGKPVSFQEVAALLGSRQIPAPRRVKPAFSPRYREREYAVWLTRHHTGSSPYGGPRSYQIDSVVATTAVEALQKWAIAIYQQDPSDPNLLILPPYISVPGTNRRARNTRDRIDAFPASGITAGNIQCGGVITDSSEQPVFEGWNRVLPDGSLVPVTEDERAIALSEWQVPNIDSFVQSEATWWKQVRRIWGDPDAASLKDWLQAHDTEREWNWFKTQQDGLIDLLHERRSFVPEIPVYWQPVELETPEARGFALRFTWSQARQACLDGYARELRLNPEPQPGKPNPIAIAANRSTISEQEFSERSAQQWQRLRNCLNERRLGILRGRLAPSALVSPACLSSAKNPFLTIVLREFWQGKIPPDILAFAQNDWRKARDLTATSELLSQE